MAAERKLKGEIDRTLKKVQEGQELFEELWVQVRIDKSSKWVQLWTHSRRAQHTIFGDPGS